jgi:predicted Mrr-cat superfamily restriction endonuclease
MILHHIPECRQKMLDWSCQEERIAIGWGEIGNASKCVSWEEIKQKIEAVPDYCRDLPPSNWVNGGHALWDLYKEMKRGDLVILVGKGSRREAVMKVTGECAEWKPKGKDYKDYQHHRAAILVGDHREADKLWIKAGGRNGGGGAMYRLCMPA